MFIKTLRKKIIILILLLGCSLLLFNPIFASSIDQSKVDINMQTGALQENSGLQYSSIGSLASGIIKTFLSLLGIIFLVLLIYGGFRYMTARGEEGKVEEALKTIRMAIIGLIIILSAYAITNFVFTRLGGGTGGSSSEYGETGAGAI